MRLFGPEVVGGDFKIFYGRLVLEIGGIGAAYNNITRDVALDEQGRTLFNGVIPPFGDIEFPPSGIPSPIMNKDLIQIRVSAGYKTDTGLTINGPKKLIGENEGYVSSYVWGALTSLGYKNSLGLFPGKSKLDDGSNFSFFSIGGSAANAVSGQMLETFGLKCGFDNMRGSITTPNGNFTIDSKADYAILAKVDNHLSTGSKKYKAFIAAGLGEVGTQGAGRFFYKEAKQLVSIFKDNNFECVLRVPFMNFDKTEIVYASDLAVNTKVSGA